MSRSPNLFCFGVMNCEATREVDKTRFWFDPPPHVQYNKYNHKFRHVAGKANGT